MKKYLRLILLVTLLLAMNPVARSQSLPGAPPVPSGYEPETPAASAQNSSEKKKVSSAWTLAYPLGQHVESTIDTVLYNYQRIAIPAMYSDAMATTGNLGSEALNMIYFNRPGPSPFFFDRSLAIWLPNIDGQKFYNVYRPMTLLAYNFGGNRDNHTDRLSAQFAGNVNRRIGVAAFMDYLYSKGCYEDQATKDYAYGANVYYTGSRYEMQVLFNAFNFLNKENGGITDDLYITDPGQLQGGDDKVESKSIPVNLTNAFTRMTGSRLFTTQAYKVGFWREEEVNDTLTREVYVPVTKFIYSLDYQTRRHRFINKNNGDAAKFFENTYITMTETDDNSYYWHLSNSLGIELMEGFQKWAKFGLSAYATYQIRKYSQTTANDKYQGVDPDGDLLTPLPPGFDIAPKVTQSLLWVGGRLEKTQGSLLKYAADAKFGIVGEAAGEIDINGRIQTNFKLLGDTVKLEARGSFSNLTPSWMLKQYISNHFAWKNDFGKIRKFNVGGELQIPWTHTTVSANFESAQNVIYFDSRSLPQQNGSTVGIFALRLHQELHFGIWNWNNTLTYQASTNQDVIPLPALAIYSNMYLAFKAFRVLTLQIGVDCDYFTRYRGMMYQPATASFHVQEKENAIKVGNYPLMNAYITAKLYQVRFFILWSHFNQGLFSKNYFSMPHYPIDPRRLQFGLSVDFAN